MTLSPVGQHEMRSRTRELRARPRPWTPGAGDDLQRRLQSTGASREAGGSLVKTSRGGRRSPPSCRRVPVARPLRVRLLRWSSTTLALAFAMAFAAHVEASPTEDSAAKSNEQVSSPPLRIEVDVTVTGHELEDQRIAEEMASSIDKGVRAKGGPNPEAIETTLLITVRMLIPPEGRGYVVHVIARSGNEEHVVDFPCPACTAGDLTEHLIRESSEALRVLATRSPPASDVRPTKHTQAEPMVPSLPPASSRFHPRRLGVAGLTLAGIGAASLLTGIGLLFAHGLERRLDGGFEGDVERLETMLAGVTTLGIGGAMTVLGMGLAGSDAHQQRKDKPDPRRMGTLGIAGFTTLGAGTTAILVGSTLAARGDVEWISPGDESVANVAYLRTPGWVTLAVGLGTAAAGATMLGVDARRRKPGRTVVLVPSVTTDSARLVLAGRF